METGTKIHIVLMMIWLAFMYWFFSAALPWAMEKYPDFPVKPAVVSPYGRC